jgi:hypothetical protein
MAIRRLGDGVDQVKGGVDGAPGVILMGGRIAEACKDSIADEPVYVATEGGEYGSAGQLVGACESPNHLGIESVRERSRTDEISEEDRLLAASPVGASTAHVALGEDLKCQRVRVVMVEHADVLDEIEYFGPFPTLSGSGGRGEEVAD